MIDLSSFSGTFPSLASFFADRAPLSDRLQGAAAVEPGDGKEAGDSLDLSPEGARKQLLSNLAGASFDTAYEEPAIAVQNGTYAPSTAVSSSFAFSFNLHIQSQRTLIASPISVHDREESGSAAIRARESSSLYYQSSLFESRRSIAGGFSEARQLQTELFYSRSRELSVNMPAEQADRFGQTSELLARTFQLDISLQFSFLGQFTRQSESIGDLDQNLLDRYLADTDSRSGSGVALQSFFDHVDNALNDVKTMVTSSLDALFAQAADTFGLDAGGIAALSSFVTDELNAFFEEVDAFLAEARASFGEPAAAPELEAAPPAPEVVDPLEEPATLV